MNAIAFASATQLAANIRTGRLSSAELVGHYLDRIATYNDTINAIVTIGADRALDRARVADTEVRTGRLRGPLHGVPITVKDSIETSGLQTTSGALELAGYTPLEDAPAVARLRAAGAIVLGKTNLPTFASGLETHSELFGTTRNPWDPSKVPGGSSGGAAGALAAGLTALELGSDVAGSIRQPAHYCGVYGHYPTRGLVPMRGHIPPRPGRRLRLDMATLGPMARSAEDLEVALAAIAGADEEAGRAWRLELPAPRHERLADYRVLAWIDDPACPVSAAVGDRLSNTVDALARAGVRIEDRPIPATLGRHRDVFMSLLGAAWSAHLADDLFEAALTGVGSFDADDPFRPRVESTVQLHRSWLLADEQRNMLVHAWAELFRDVDIVLCPVTPTPAIALDPHPERLADASYRFRRTMMVDGASRPYTDQMVWCGVPGVAGLPATVAPIGRSPDGLPVGVQIVGPHLEDRTCIAFAGHLSDIAGGFEAPSAFASRDTPGVRVKASR